MTKNITLWDTNTGDFFVQGREVAVFSSSDSEGFIENSPMVWGVQPHKGNLFIADHNSGLWSVNLAPPKELKN